MENYFESFKEQIANNQKKKSEEDRINQYLKNTEEEFNTKKFYKEIHEKRLCKVINYSQINHLNTFNNSENIT